MSDTADQTKHDDALLTRYRRLHCSLNQSVQARHLPRPQAIRELLDAVDDPAVDQDKSWQETAWQVITNSDLTEGRGQPVVLATCYHWTTAERLAVGAGVQGTDATIEQVHIVRGSGDAPGWYARIFPTMPSEDDIARTRERGAQKQAECDKEAALQRARDAGLSDADIDALRAG